MNDHERIQRLEAAGIPIYRSLAERAALLGAPPPPEHQPHDLSPQEDA